LRIVDHHAGAIKYPCFIGEALSCWNNMLGANWGDGARPELTLNAAESGGRKQ